MHVYSPTHDNKQFKCLRNHKWPYGMLLLDHALKAADTLAQRKIWIRVQINIYLFNFIL